MTLIVTHLGNIHKVSLKDYDKNDANMNNIVFSQYNLAKFLATQADIPVVEEGNIKDFYASDLPSEICNIIDTNVFPNGLPSEFQKLSEIQKHTLHELGAAKTLLCMDILPKIYQAINPENNDKNALNNILETMLKLNKDMNFDIRETYALEYAKIAAEKHYKEADEGQVFIIFGANHNFQKEAISNGFMHNKIKFYEEEDLVKVSDQELILTQEILKVLESQNIFLNENQDGFI